MTEKLLVPSIEKRMSTLIEINRRNLTGYSVTDKGKAMQAITISREFGCEGFPVAERLKAILEEKTAAAWVLLDKALLEEVAKNHNLSEHIFMNLGEKNRFLDDMLSTFSPRWPSDKDHYRLLCRQIVALASGGNVIIVGRGASILTQEMKNCFHFRIVASLDFKTRTIARRLNLPPVEAGEIVKKKQRQRDSFIRDFLNRDVTDISLYHLIFNNEKNSADRIAETISDYVLTASASAR
jgi:cytidylate kinase